MKTEDQTVSLWDSLDVAKESGDPEAIRVAINSLIVAYYSLVENISERIAPKLKEITAEECASYGVDGLYEAIEKFDRTKGIQFRTFAPHRIRGAILDNIRKVDWVPRLVRQRNTLIDRLKESFYKTHGYNPSDSDMAEILHYSKDQFDTLSQKATPTGVSSMHNNPSGEQDGEFEEMLNVKDSKDGDPIFRMLRDEMFKKLLGHDFTKLERRIVYLAYYESLTMKEIAVQTNFSESRISQMHSEIIRRLKQKVERNPLYAVELEKILESR